MEYLEKVRKSTTTGATVFLVIGIVAFFIPGFLALVAGNGGAVFGVIAILGSMIFIIPSIKAITNKGGEQAFLNQVDCIGARDSVLAAIDGTQPLDGVKGSDVRLHPAFIAVRTGNLANIWRADSIVWVFRKDNNVTSKSQLYGVTIAKTTQMQYSVELWNNERRNISIAVADENGADRLMFILKQIYPNVVYGYSAALESAYQQDPMHFWKR